MLNKMATFTFTLKDLVVLTTWICISIAATKAACVIGEVVATNDSAFNLALVWFFVFIGGAAAGRAVGLILGKKLVCMVIGIFAWPVVVIGWTYYL